MYVPDWKMIGTDPAVITVMTGEGEATVLIAIDTHRHEEITTGRRIRRQGVAIVIVRLRLNMLPCPEWLNGGRPSTSRVLTHGIMSRPTKG